MTTLGLSIVISSTVTFANQGTDSLKGPVTCSGNGFSVTITANRKLIMILKDNESLKTYKVEQMAGDTETNYTALGAQAPVLSFNDQGDFLMFNSTQNGVSISCPQGS